MEGETIPKSAESALRAQVKSAEAAFLVNVAHDELLQTVAADIMPNELVTISGGTMSLSMAACILLSFYFSSVEELTPDMRGWTVRTVGGRLARSQAKSPAAVRRHDWQVDRGYITVDVRQHVDIVGARARRLADAKQMVTSTSAVLGGEPVIRGTRVPIYDVAASMKAGHPIQRVLEAYPGLDVDHVSTAVIFARVNPPHMSDANALPLPEGAEVVAQRRISLQRDES